MKFLKTIIVALLVAGLFSIAQHHHDDFDEHDDCPVCALVHDGVEFVDYTPQVIVFYSTLFVLRGPAPICVEKSRYRFYRPRAPPVPFA